MRQHGCEIRNREGSLTHAETPGGDMKRADAATHLLQANLRDEHNDLGGFASNFTSTERGGRRRPRVTLMGVVVTTLLFGVALTCINVWELRRLQNEHFSAHHAGPSGAVPGVAPATGAAAKKPIVWVHAKNPTSGYLKHVFVVFERLGYQTVTSHVSNWDVLWCHDYPFMQLKDEMMNLKIHQRVNHFPGTGFVTNKLFLATSDIKHVPKAFKIPKDKEDLLSYAKMHPNTKWVQKGSNHRGVKIKKLEELNFNMEDSFIQEYIDDPYLIDGRRFDIGIYTVVTSIDPLRIYVNHGDWLVRFCPKQYHPFDESDILKYVITDDYLPLWMVPSLKKLYTSLNFPFKETLLTYLKSQGGDTERLVADIHETVRQVYLTKEDMLIKAAAKYKSSKYFFEMVRFDFILDRQLNVYLLEVNMSPNLSSGHFPANKLLYEQTLFGMLSIVGFARAVGGDLVTSGTDEANMQVSDRDVSVFADNCHSEVCEENCLKQECKLCGECLTIGHRFELKRAHLEHNNRKNWRRVMPKPFKSQAEAVKWVPSSDESFQGMSARNKWMARWFHGKCLQDASWCF